MNLPKNRLRADLWLPRVKEAGRWVNEEFGISKCKLLYIEQINKRYHYSMGNYIQYPIRNHNEKDYVRECVCVCVCVYIYIYICICITELLCCTEIYM